MNEVNVVDTYSDEDGHPLTNPSAELSAFLDKFETVTIENNPVLMDSEAPLEDRRAALLTHLQGIESDSRLKDDPDFRITSVLHTSKQTPSGWDHSSDIAAVHHEVIDNNDEFVCCVGIEEPVPPVA